MLLNKKAQFNTGLFCGESRIRTCEVHTADLQSALVGRLSISPINYFNLSQQTAANITTLSSIPNL
jgi:hypothetical protein